MTIRALARAIGPLCLIALAAPRVAAADERIAEAYIDAPRAAYVVVDDLERGTLGPDDLVLRDPAGEPIPISRVRSAPDPRDLGVRREGEGWTFLFDPGRQGGGLDGEAGIYVVGDFNGWQKAHGKKRWRMSWDDAEGAFVLHVKRLPRGANEFKFHDGRGWRPDGGNLRVHAGGARGFILETERPLDGRGVHTVALASNGDARDLIPRGIFYHGEIARYRCDRPMGAQCDEEKTSFRLFAPTATTVFLLLEAGTAGTLEGAREIELAREDDYTFAAEVAGDHHGRRYAYRLTGPGLDPARPVADPYARCLVQPDGAGLVLDPDRCRPAGFDPAARPDFLGVVADETPNSPEDAIVYELHVRDATASKDSGAAAKERGKYLGLARRGTRSPDGLPTGIDHMVDLGVTHVQVLPLHAYSDDRRDDPDDYNWGYMPRHYFSPEGRYATRRDDETRVLECKQMIGAMHEAGLRVVLDVVFNHTDGSAPFHRVAPFFYYRTRPFEPANRCYWNGSGCGNELRTEHPVVRQLVVDSCVLWAREYGVDGFRFDLMGLIDLPTMDAVVRGVRAVDPSIVVWGEPWTAAGTPIDKTEQGDQQGRGFAAFNDRMRNAIKGGNGDGETGFIQTGAREHADKVKNGIEGAVNVPAGGFAADPGETVNYVACHDNRTLWDKIVERGARDDAGRRHLLASALVLTSQGIPFLHAGQEMFRTKGGDHNSYQSSDAVNAIRWSWARKNRGAVAWHRGLIALRKAHPVFRLSRRDQIIGGGARLAFLGAPDGVIAWTLDGRDLPGETWSRVAVLVNATGAAQRVDLPGAPGGWTIVVDEDEAGTSPVRTGPRRAGEDGGPVGLNVPPLSVVVLHARDDGP